MYRIIAFILASLGGLNWLMIGALQYDFVAGLFGTQSNVFSRIIYVLIGVSAMYILIIALVNTLLSRRTRGILSILYIALI